MARPAQARCHGPPRRHRTRLRGELTVPFAFPLALEITGRRCVVIGAGATAAAKVAALLDAGASVVVIAAEPDAGLPDEFGALIDLIAGIRA